MSVPEKQLDRRWLFALTILVVGLPLLLRLESTQREVSQMVTNVYEAIDNLPEGSLVLLPFDYDPSAEGELQPMADVFVRHCAERKHKLIFLTIWPQGVGMIQRATNLLQQEYPEYRYGIDFVNLGYRPGYEVVINTVINDLPSLYDADQVGTPVRQIPLMRGVENIRNIPLIINVSSGDPGLKQWIQYAATPYESINIVAGTTGVQASTLYPYIPHQMIGMLPSLKSAAEYEQRLLKKYPHIGERESVTNTAQLRMMSQDAAHVMLIAFIVVSNLIFLLRRRGERAV